MPSRSTPFVRPTVVLVLLCLTSMSACSKNNGGGGGGGGITNPPSGDSFDSGDMNQGQSFQFTFPTAATVGYHCRHHAEMTGTISIATGQADSAVVSMVSNRPYGHAFSPSTVSIKPTGYVRWVNNDAGVVHTATSN